MTNRTWIAAALPLIAVALPLHAAAPPRLKLLSSVDGGKPTAEWKYVKAGQQVVLHAELTPADARWEKTSWFKLEATVGSLDNTQPSFHFEPVRYQHVELIGCRGKLTCPADVTPTKLPLVRRAPGLGTMAFQVNMVLADGSTLASPGIESVKYGGLTPAVHRVTVRKDDSYLGYVTELFNTPYIFGSAGPDGRNQSDLLIGSDCADLAVYAKRRMGQKLTYESSYSIDKHAPEIARADTLDEKKVGLDAKGTAVRWGGKKGEIAPGDLIHFPNSRHVGILWEDLEPLGVLDSGDLMVHTCWAPPTVEPIADTVCSSVPMRILRFRK